MKCPDDAKDRLIFYDGNGDFMLGFIGAMEEEIEQIVSSMENVKIVEKSGFKFYVGMLSGKEIVVVRAGIGKVNAAICTQLMLDSFEVDGVINTGIAGSLNSEINIGDIVLSSDVLHHDVDATNFGYPPGQIPRMDVLSFPADSDMISVAQQACALELPHTGVFVGRIVSGDQFISSHEVKARIIENFGGFATEMEGAAIGQTAYVNNIPFLVVRAVSDKADDSATLDYPTFEKQAIANMVKLVKRFVAMM